GEAGFVLRERLTIYPEYVLAGEPWLDPRLFGHVAALADPVTGLAREDAVLQGRPWQEPDGGFAASGRVDLHVEVDTSGRTNDRRDDFDNVYGDWEALRERLDPAVRIAPPAADQLLAAPAPGEQKAVQAIGGHTPSEVRAALRRAEADPAGLSEAEAVALLSADGGALDELARIADDLRGQAVGDEVTYVVNRNINFTNVCYTGCRFCAFAQRRTDADAYTLSLDQVADRAEEAWRAGATEVCMQGGIHPDLPGTAYFDLARAVKARTPGMHVHAFSPMEVINGASRTNLSIEDWLHAAKEAGVDSLPGTAAEILDDDVRWVLTKGKLPTKEWIDVITTAHRVGIPTTSTMMYGHVDTHVHWVRHIKLIRRLQEESGGFSEFVLLPFVHTSSPIYLAGVARPGPTAQENRAVHALARILLHGAIANIQCSWVKLQDDLCHQVLQGGVNDLGGTLMEETISRMAGSENGSYKTISELRAMVEVTGRPVRQRTTEYGRPDGERLAASAASDGVCQSVRRVLPMA
ncbi:MAG TPA: 5-amino-6-(D-ribitylamino)uracil--L-tyrosine 4-hydroxyphenyl transferase CofH, partial [Nonomuraea sp.]|nr:5-amino-6-(D-ribitylamino)uracil--L-tyrosine 4-hydroxyphenyl transferase CofH [Nonomuraea sp.]